MKRSMVKDLLTADSPQDRVLVKGWVRTKRDAKDFAFLEINDGSHLNNIQVIADAALENFQEVAALTTGSSLAVEGALVVSPAKGQKYEIKADKVLIYGLADPQKYPLQKKRHSFEFLREIAHLRPRTNTFGAVLRVRNALSYAIHSFFQEKGFLYIQTPIITASDCEGAGEMFQVTCMDLDRLRTQKEAIQYEDDFFGKKTGLTVSGQLEAELLALAMDKVYTFGPTFRAENSNTSRHLAEFWMVEPEIAFAELSDDIALAEEFLKYIFTYCLEHCSADLEFFNNFIKKGIIENITRITQQQFEIISYTEAIAILEKSGNGFEFPVAWGSDLQSEHERYLTEHQFQKPVVVVDYPKAIKAFYMKLNEDDATVRAMDVLVPGVGEIIGGSEREYRYDVLLARLQAAGLKPEDYAWYLDIRAFGSVPHAGFGLGFERLVQFMTGMHNIRDVIPFPRTPKNAMF
jgi:asparaginyl-tRNA synthetase